MNGPHLGTKSWKCKMQFPTWVLLLSLSITVRNGSFMFKSAMQFCLGMANWRVHKRLSRPVHFPPSFALLKLDFSWAYKLWVEILSQGTSKMNLFLKPWIILRLHMLLMPCPSMCPKWFWTIQIILVDYQSFWGVQSWGVGSKL